MRLSPLTLATLGFLTVAGPANANPAIERDFRAQARIIPTQALRAGYQRFGSLDLASILSAQERLNVSVVSQVKHWQDVGVAGAERETAEWSHGQVRVSAKAWPKIRSSAKPMLSFHETLGALRIQDDNFGCSSSIWILVNNNARNVLSEDERRLVERNADASCVQARSGGGSTGITGGGDDYNVNIRMNAVNEGIAEMRRAASREQRDHAFSSMLGMVYNEWGRSNNAKIREKILGGNMNEIPVPQPVIEESIRVYSDLEMTIPIPRDARNGWTYDRASGSVRIHGKWRRTSGVGVVVRSSRR